MVSEKNIELTRQHARVLSKLRASPFRWDPCTETYQSVPHRLPYCYFQLLSTFLHLISPLAHLFLCINRNRFPYSLIETVVCVTAFLFLCTIFLETLVIVVLHEDSLAVLNSMELFIERFTAEHYKTCKRPRYLKFVDILVTATDMHLRSHFVIGGVLCWVTPKFPILLSSWLPENFEGSLMLYLVQTVYLGFFSYHMICSAYLCSFVSCHGLSTLPMFVWVMRKECKPSVSQGHRGISGLLLYRQVELLLCIYWKFYGSIFLPAEAILTAGITVYSSGLIVFWRRVKPAYVSMLFVGWLIAVVCLVVIFEIGGRFDLDSRKTLGMWKKVCLLKTGPYRTLKTKEIMKYLKSFRPLKFNFNGYRKVSRIAILQIIRSIAKNTFRAVTTLYNYS